MENNYKCTDVIILQGNWYLAIALGVAPPCEKMPKIVNDNNKIEACSIV